jgi:hypothetical protein
MFAIDKITGNRVKILRNGAAGAERCVVIRHPDGSEQLQFKTLLISCK